MKKRLLGITTLALTCVISIASSIASADTPTGNTNTSASASSTSNTGPNPNTPTNCIALDPDAVRNMNENLDKLGYGHPSSIATRPVYQILVTDKTNKQQTLFFDFDPKTGNMIGTGVAQ